MSTERLHAQADKKAMTGFSFPKLSIKAVDLVWPETVTNQSAPLFRLYSTQERAGVLDKEFESISMKILIKYLQHRRCQNSHDPQSWNIYKNKEVLGLELFLASSLYVRPAKIKIRRSSLLVLVIKVLDFQTDTQTKSFGVQIHTCDFFEFSPPIIHCSRSSMNHEKEFLTWHPNTWTFANFVVKPPKARACITGNFF